MLIHLKLPLRIEFPENKHNFCYYNNNKIFILCSTTSCLSHIERTKLGHIEHIEESKTRKILLAIWAYDEQKYDGTLCLLISIRILLLLYLQSSIQQEISRR